MRLSFADDAGLASQGSKKIAELRGFDHDCASGLCSYTTTPLLAGPPVFTEDPCMPHVPKARIFCFI